MPSPAASRPRAALDRDQIVDVALTLVDRDGFSALSMRRVATELEVGTMSLYWHVRTREDLLDLMFERAMSEQLLPTVPADWRSALEQIAHGARRVFQRHPWLVEVGPRQRAGTVLLSHIEQSIAATAGTRLPIAHRMAVISAVDDYVLGHVLWQHLHPPVGMPQLTEAAAAALAAGDYPHLAQVTAATAATGSQDSWSDARQFEVGLALLLDGVAAAIAAATDTAAPAATAVTAATNAGGRPGQQSTPAPTTPAAPAPAATVTDALTDALTDSVTDSSADTATAVTAATAAPGGSPQ